MTETTIKRTEEELTLINDYMYESNNSICCAISILEIFIEAFSFDMARPTDANLYYIKDRWNDVSNILYTIKSQLDTASDKLEEVLYKDVGKK